MIRKKLAKKLRSNKGETIAETMMALLIAALAMTMLAGAMVASGRVVTTSRKKLQDYYSTNEDTPSEQGTISVTMTDGGFVSEELSVDYTVNATFGDTKKVILYQPHNSSTTGGQ